MDKKYISVAEAIKLINDGYTIYYDLADGYAAVKKKSKMVYEFIVYTKDETTVFNGNIHNLMKTLNEKNIRNALYIKH
jgi:acyl CoA:acetate/3-ketoacid CoA transferase alpha subunit